MACVLTTVRHEVNNSESSVVVQELELAYRVLYGVLVTSITLVNVYVDLLVFTRIAGTS